MNHLTLLRWSWTSARIMLHYVFDRGDLSLLKLHRSINQARAQSKD